MIYVLALLIATAFATETPATCSKDKENDCCVFEGKAPAEGFTCGKGKIMVMSYAEDGNCAGDALGGSCDTLGVCKVDDKTLPATCDDLAKFAKDNMGIDSFELDKCYVIGEEGAKSAIKVTCTDKDKGSSAAALSVAAVFSGLLAML